MDNLQVENNKINTNIKYNQYNIINYNNILQLLNSQQKFDDKNKIYNIFVRDLLKIVGIGNLRFYIKTS